MLGLVPSAKQCCQRQGHHHVLLFLLLVVVVVDLLPETAYTQMLGLEWRGDNQEEVATPAP